MISRTFIWKEWEETGEIGFMPAWMSAAANPATGPVIPHDILEHFDRGYTPCIDELMAIGALNRTRYELFCEPIFNRGYNHPYEYSSAYDVMNILKCKRESMDIGRHDPIPVPPATRKHFPDKEGLDRFDLAAKEGIINYSLEYDDSEGESEYLGEILEEENLAGDKILRDRLAGWLRYGYRQAKLRYPDFPHAPPLRSAFEALERLANRTKDVCVEYNVDQYTKVTFSVSLSKRKVKAKIAHSWGDEAPYEFSELGISF